MIEKGQEQEMIETLQGIVETRGFIDYLSCNTPSCTYRLADWNIQLTYQELFQVLEARLVKLTQKAHVLGIYGVPAKADPEKTQEILHAVKRP